MAKNSFWDLLCLIAFIFTIMIVGNGFGKNLPKEMPKVHSIALEKFIPQEKSMDLKHLKDKKGIAQMFVTYNLAAFESSQSRQVDVKNDMWLFFDIVDALPCDIVIPMFRFSENTIEIDFNGTFEELEVFCQQLGKTGKFITVNYTEKDSSYVVEVKKSISDIE